MLVTNLFTLNHLNVIHDSSHQLGIPSVVWISFTAVRLNILIIKSTVEKNPLLMFPYTP